MGDIVLIKHVQGRRAAEEEEEGEEEEIEK